MQKSGGSSSNEPPSSGGGPIVEPRRTGGLFGWLKGIRGLRNGESALRDTFEELIEEHETREQPIDPDERMLLANILKFGGLTATDVMIPRADIVAVEKESSLQDVITLMTTEAHSRVPVYRDTLDDVVGMVHMKDVLGASTGKAAFSLHKMVRKVLFVAPSMHVLDLLLQMRETRNSHGIRRRRIRRHRRPRYDRGSGEEIVGEIEDEHDVDPRPHLEVNLDGSIVADARVPVNEFEDQVGAVLTDEEREENIDTLGGLVAHLTGRVPTRGELVVHKPSGVEFEVLDADPRRVKRLRVRLEPSPSSAND